MHDKAPNHRECCVDLSVSESIYLHHQQRNYRLIKGVYFLGLYLLAYLMSYNVQCYCLSPMLRLAIVSSATAIRWWSCH